jgi:hypothetical protein
LSNAGFGVSARNFGTAGVIAQLGERFNGIEEVGGSIPPGSTSHFAKTGESPGAITAHGRSLGGSLGPA